MKVSLFCVGAAKAGTTSIFELLRSSKELEIPIDKEPHYFGEFCVGPKKFKTVKEYHTNYENLGSEKMAVDFSTSYLYSKTAAQEIYDYNKDSKILILLREPFSRAVSLYNHQRRSMLESHDMIEGFAKESERIKKGYDYGFHYKTSGLYYEQVKRYFEVFPKEQILVLDFEDLIKEPKVLLKKILYFYGITDIDESSLYLPKENRTGIPKNKLLQYFLVRNYPFKKIFKKVIPKNVISYLKSNNVGNKEKPEACLKKQLESFFIEDQRKLNKLIKDNCDF